MAEMDHAAIRRHTERHHADRVRHILGHRDGGHADAAQDKALIREAVLEHEKHDHPGKMPTKLKLRDGGAAEGHKGRRRLDRGQRRRDDGGSTGNAQNMPNSAQSPDNTAMQNAINSALTNSLSNQAQQQKTPSMQNRGGRTKRADGGKTTKVDSAWPDNMNVRNGGRTRRADGGRLNGPTAREDGAGDSAEEMARHDDRQNYADGGKVRHKGASHVNVIVATPGQSRPVPVPVPAAAAPMPQRPPMPPPGAGAPPGGMPPGMPMRPPMAGGAPGMMPPGAAGVPGMMMHADGGRTSHEGRDARGPDPIEKVREKNERMYGELRADGGRTPRMTAGAESGEGRMEKSRAYGKPKSALAAGD
jgi:hypothetical protein